MFYMILPSLEKRQELIAFLKEREILSVFHYLPLHLSDMGLKFGGNKGDCPVTEDLSDRLLRLPFYNSFTESEQMEVIDTIKDWSKQISK
jgi:dTDP-4-amino-4,6-dideoxygalactose transaminase